MVAGGDQSGEGCGDVDGANHALSIQATCEKRVLLAKRGKNLLAPLQGKDSKQ